MGKKHVAPTLPHHPRTPWNWRQLEVGALPSVGWAVGGQLRELGIVTVADLRAWPLDRLRTHLGNKVGETLYHFARGEDDRPLASLQPRKTVGAEVNWGIRFEEEAQVVKFLGDLATEVAGRLRAAAARGRTITLKAGPMQRAYAGWPG